MPADVEFFVKEMRGKYFILSMTLGLILGGLIVFKWQEGELHTILLGALGVLMVGRIIRSRMIAGFSVGVLMGAIILDIAKPYIETHLL